jgi:hypothetical protein
MQLMMERFAKMKSAKEEEVGKDKQLNEERIA